MSAHETGTIESLSCLKTVSTRKLVVFRNEGLGV